MCVNPGVHPYKLVRSHITPQNTHAHKALHHVRHPRHTSSVTAAASEFASSSATTKSSPALFITATCSGSMPDCKKADTSQHQHTTRACAQERAEKAQCCCLLPQLICNIGGYLFLSHTLSFSVSATIIYSTYKKHSLSPPTGRRAKRLCCLLPHYSCNSGGIHTHTRTGICTCIHTQEPAHAHAHANAQAHKTHAQAHTHTYAHALSHIYIHTHNIPTTHTYTQKHDKAAHMNLLVPEFSCWPQPGRPPAVLSPLEPLLLSQQHNAVVDGRSAQDIRACQHTT